MRSLHGKDELAAIAALYTQLFPFSCLLWLGLETGASMGSIWVHVLLVESQVVVECV